MICRLISIMADILILPLLLAVTPLSKLNLNPKDPDASKPIVMFHGLGYNQAGFIFLRLYLKFSGFKNVYSFNLDDSLLGSTLTLDEYRMRAKEKIDHVYRIHKKDIAIIGHSFGGIIGGIMLNRYPSKISHLITMGTPWHGSETVYTYERYIKRFFTFISLNDTMFDLVPESEKLTKLRKNIDKSKVYNIGSKQDVLLKHKNKRSYILVKDKQRIHELKWHGHNTLLISLSSFRKIKFWLKSK